MILFIENFKDITRNLPELINESGKVAGYKINIRNLSHFYTLTTNYEGKKLRK